MNKELTELFSVIPNAIASPFTEWHQDDLRTEIILQRERFAHEERMKHMELVSKERIANAQLATQYLETLQTAMETGNLDPLLGESLKRLPMLLN